MKRPLKAFLAGAGMGLWFFVPSALALDIQALWDDPNPPGLVQRWEVQWRNPNFWNTATVTPASTHAYTAVNVQPGPFEIQIRGCDISNCSEWKSLATKAPSKPGKPSIGGP